MPEIKFMFHDEKIAGYRGGDVPIPRVGEHVVLNVPAGINVKVPTTFRVAQVRHVYSTDMPHVKVLLSDRLDPAAL
jgi:hypothetical protein